MNEHPCEDWLEEHSSPMAQEALSLIRVLRQELMKQQPYALDLFVGSRVKVKADVIQECDAWVRKFSFATENEIPSIVTHQGFRHNIPAPPTMVAEVELEVHLYEEFR